MKRKLYLAYGSNLSLTQMEYRCPDAHIVGISEIKDYRLVYKGSGSGNYATVEPADGYIVPVLVWSISEQDERNLDRYEGYNEKGYCFYTKEYMTVDIEDTVVGTIEGARAMIYIMDPKRDYGLPSIYYHHILVDGYRMFGFDLNILDEAKRYTVIQKDKQKA